MWHTNFWTSWSISIGCQNKVMSVRFLPESGMSYSDINGGIYFNNFEIESYNKIRSSSVVLQIYFFEKVSTLYITQKNIIFWIPEIHEEVLGLVVEGVQLERHVWKSWNLAMTFYFLAHYELSNILDMVPSWWQAFYLRWCAKIWCQGKGTNPLEGCQYAQLPMLATGIPKRLICKHIDRSYNEFTRWFH